MAHRPIFLPGAKKGALFQEISVQFQWHPGFARSQKLKSVRELHKAAKTIGYANVLEVSTKSELALGQRLSAFTLDTTVSGVTAKIECIYQASKVFEKAGPFPELADMRPIEAKRYFRDKNIGLITHFEFGNTIYDNLPHHAFYDWLFLRALIDHEAFLTSELAQFDAFSDIEFNPSRSVNTQARTAAIIASLIERDEFTKCADDYNYFRTLLAEIERKTSTQIELGLAS